MRVSDWTAGVECDGAGVSGTRAGMRPKCLLIILRSLSELALLDLPSSLAGALSTSSQTGHPCRSLMICRTQQSAFSRTFMPVAVARLTHDIFFSVTRPSFAALDTCSLRIAVCCLDKHTPSSLVQQPRPSRPAQLILLLRARSLRDRFPLPANVTTAFLHAARNLSWLASPSAARCSDTSTTTTTTEPLSSLAPTDICSALD